MLGDSDGHILNDVLLDSQVERDDAIAVVFRQERIFVDAFHFIVFTVPGKRLAIDDGDGFLMHVIGRIDSNKEGVVDIERIDEGINSGLCEWSVCKTRDRPGITIALADFYGIFLATQELWSIESVTRHFALRMAIEVSIYSQSCCIRSSHLNRCYHWIIRHKDSVGFAFVSNNNLLTNSVVRSHCNGNGDIIFRLVTADILRNISNLNRCNYVLCFWSIDEDGFYTVMLPADSLDGESVR